MVCDKMICEDDSNDNDKEHDDDNNHENSKIAGYITKSTAVNVFNEYNDDKHTRYYINNSANSNNK